MSGRSGRKKEERRERERERERVKGHESDKGMRGGTESAKA